MCVKSLAEGIILQSIEDLFSSEHINGSMDFFRGEEFRSCAEMAGMSMLEQVRVLNMIRKVTDYQISNGTIPQPASYHPGSAAGIAKREAVCSTR